MIENILSHAHLLLIFGGICFMVMVAAFFYEAHTGKFVDQRWVTIPFFLMLFAVLGFFVFIFLSEIVR